MSSPVSFIPETQWKGIYTNLQALSFLERFRNFEAFFQKDPFLFQSFYESSAPEDEKMPPKYIEKKFPSDKFGRLLLIKTFRPDKLLQAITKFISDEMGNKFTEFIPPQLEELYEISNQLQPLIIILSQGTDPKADFDKLCE